jgi:hypothetical protein
MNSIDAAIEAVESHEAGASFSYRKVVKQFKVDCKTFLQRHQGLMRLRKAAAAHKQLLNPQQEEELVRYIGSCTEQGLSPTREMIQNFASAVAKWEASESWVMRFLPRHEVDLTIKWSTEIDCDCYYADSHYRYNSYFQLLHGKMREYKVEPGNTYNMDEKSFFVGVTARSKRVFLSLYQTGFSLNPWTLVAMQSPLHLACTVRSQAKDS